MFVSSGLRARTRGSVPQHRKERYQEGLMKTPSIHQLDLAQKMATLYVRSQLAQAKFVQTPRAHPGPVQHVWLQKAAVV